MLSKGGNQELNCQGGYVKGLVKMGLEGLETYYPYNGLRGLLKFHSTEKVIEVAEQNTLIKTGGTDSHGLKLL